MQSLQRRMVLIRKNSVYCCLELCSTQVNHSIACEEQQIVTLKISTSLSPIISAFVLKNKGNKVAKGKEGPQDKCCWWAADDKLGTCRIAGRKYMFKELGHQCYVTTGVPVPQGSVLGPVLFVCYINDMHAVVKSMIYMYADDAEIG